MPVTKNRDAYRRYTTFVSDQSGYCQQASLFFFFRVKKRKRTLVFDKIAHACAASEDELRHILDNLGLLLRRHRHEPFRKAHFA
jgi:hypothetical protein